MSDTSISQRICDFVLNFSGEDLPDAARHVMQLSLLDWVAVTVAGRDEPVSKILREMVADEAGAEQAYVLGLKRAVPARAAALANGTAGHALDYDDTHFGCLAHPSAAVVPAAMAIADLKSVSPRAFQEAALIGVEVACRVGAWLGPEHYRIGLHMTASAGTIGAAAAAARLLGLTPDQMRNAIGLAATLASGTKAQFGTMGKPFHAGHAAAGGVEAALLAARGMVAAADGLDGPQGFGATHHGAENIAAFDGFGKAFVFETVQHKFHACCHGTHAALDALSILKERQEIAPDAVSKITIRTAPGFLRVCNIVEPSTGLEAKFSYRMVTALSLLGHDTARLDTFNDALCRDPAVLALRDRVQAVGDETVSETASKVQIDLQDGASISATSDLSTLTDIDARTARVRAKAGSLLGDERAADIWGRITREEGVASQWMRG
ncbi:MAG: MmgE/PrpD family protein [Marinosulfonomonas sp.]|nr:MmgE/PrpD family protein [Marinosulfonomonas sp.]